MFGIIQSKVLEPVLNCGKKISRFKRNQGKSTFCSQFPVHLSTVMCFTFSIEHLYSQTWCHVTNSIDTTAPGYMIGVVTFFKLVLKLSSILSLICLNYIYSCFFSLERNLFRAISKERTNISGCLSCFNEPGKCVQFRQMYFSCRHKNVCTP